MSGSTAKQARRVERLTEAIDPGQVAPLGHQVGFDAAFRQLCLDHQVRAVFILADGETPRGTRLLTGGDAELSAFVDREMRR